MDELTKRTPRRELRYGIKALILSFVMLMIAFPSYARNGNITINVSDVPMQTVLKKIEQQTDYRFFYSKDAVNVSSKVSLNVTNEPLTAVLDKLFDSNGISYRINKKQIVLTKGGKAEPKAGSATEAKNKKKGETVHVTGYVRDEAGEPLIGVTVMDKGTMKGAATDVDGKYEIDVPVGSSLKYSYVGYDPVSKKVNGAGELDVTMSEGANVLNEVVVMGYGATSRKNLTTSIATVKTDKIQKGAISNVNSMLLGRAAGVQATISSPQPGGGINISVRGGGNPVYVIDGVVVPNSSMEPGTGSVSLPTSVNRAGLQGLNPSDIESIEVLKDASAAIYGIGAADGVILITTKKGKEGKPTVTYEGSVAWQRHYKYTPLLDGPELMNMVNLFSKENYLYDKSQYPYGSVAYDGKWSPIFTEQQILNAPNYDWLGDEFRTGFINNHNININGGTDRVKYYLGMNYYNELATVRNSNMERFALRTNIQTKITDFIRLTTIVNVNKNNYRNSTNGGDQGNLQNQGAGALFAAQTYPTYLTPYDEDGNYTQFVNVPNPVALRKIADSTKTTAWYVNLALDIDIIKNWLTFRGVYGINNETSERDSYIPSDVYFGLQRKSRGNVGFGKRLNSTLEGFLNFQHQLGEIVDLSAMIGMGRYLDKGNGFNVSYENANDKLTSESIEKAEGPYYPASYKYANEKRSQFARVSADFLNRYVISATIRRDGTDKFFPGKKYSWFPSVSLAWKMHEEKFLRDVEWINMLKIRASYGETGSDNLGTTLYGTINTTREDVKFDGNSVTYIPFILSGANYDDVTWQKTTMKNIGIDFSILNDRLSGSVDLFRNDIIHLLGTAPTELLGMHGTRPINGGHFRREGIDVTLNSTNIWNSEFKWTTTLTLSHYNAVWVKRMPNYDYQVYQKRKNEPVNYTYYYNCLGYVNADRSNVTDTQRTLGPAACMPGYPIVEDTNGDGAITAEDIQTYNTTPKLYYGMGNNFSWKGFDLDIFFYGQLGVKKWNTAYQYSVTGDNFPRGVTSHNVPVYIYQAWNSQTNSGKDAKFAGISAYKVNLPGNVGTNQNLEDASYLRIRNITLGYTIPAKAMKVFHGYMKEIRVYADFQNPFTFTRYKGLDPEINTGAASLSGGQFPQTRAYTIGLKLVF